MSFFDTLCEMLVILFAMAMGFLARRLEYFNGETDQRLSKVVLNITMPASSGRVSPVMTAATIMAGMVMFKTTLDSRWSVSLLK